MMLSIALFSDDRFSVFSWGTVDTVELEIDMCTKSVAQIMTTWRVPLVAH